MSLQASWLVHLGLLPASPLSPSWAALLFSWHLAALFTLYLLLLLTCSYCRCALSLLDHIILILFPVMPFSLFIFPSSPFHPCLLSHPFPCPAESPCPGPSCPLPQALPHSW